MGDLCSFFVHSLHQCFKSEQYSEKKNKLAETIQKLLLSKAMYLIACIIFLYI